MGDKKAKKAGNKNVNNQMVDLATFGVDSIPYKYFLSRVESKQHLSVNHVQKLDKLLYQSGLVYRRNFPSFGSPSLPAFPLKSNKITLGALFVVKPEFNHTIKSIVLLLEKMGEITIPIAPPTPINQCEQVQVQAAKQNE